MAQSNLEIPETARSSRTRSVALQCVAFTAVFVATTHAFEPPPLTHIDEPLAGTRWLVEDIDGRGVIDFAQTTVEFLEGSRISGSTGCNAYNGNVVFKAASKEDGVEFGPLAVTMRACAEALMHQEHAFLRAVEAVRAYTVAENGLLHLLDGDGRTLLRLSKMERGAPVD